MSIQLLSSPISLSPLQFCLPPQHRPPSSLRRHSSFVTRNVFLPVLSAITPVLCSVRRRPALLTPPAYLNDHTLISYLQYHCIASYDVHVFYSMVLHSWRMGAVFFVLLCLLLLLALLTECATALLRGDPEVDCEF